MARGILGFRRLTSIGPLTYSSNINGTDDVEDILTDIFDERGIEDGDELSGQEFASIVNEMTNRIYPDGGEVFNIAGQSVSEEQIFRQCLNSRWSELWETGFTNSTTGSTEVFEELIIKANGCSGIAEAGPAGVRVLVTTR